MKWNELSWTKFYRLHIWNIRNDSQPSDEELNAYRLAFIEEESWRDKPLTMDRLGVLLARIHYYDGLSEEYTRSFADGAHAEIIRGVKELGLT